MELWDILIFIKLLWILEKSAYNSLLFLITAGFQILKKNVP